MTALTDDSVSSFLDSRLTESFSLMTYTNNMINI